jgi:predicted phage terminase large subunit-like protein
MKEVASKIYARSLQAFVEKAHRSVHGKKLDRSQTYITFVIWTLEQLMAGDTKNLLINIPGRHLKTFICSICLPAFMLGLDPTLKFMIVAYNEDIAADIVRQIREVMESSWYKAAFGTRISGVSRNDDFTIKGGGRVRAVAVRSITGKGGDVIIFDDAHNALDWDSDRAKRKVIESFEMLVSRRDGGKLSRMLVVGHRVAEDDLSAHILDRDDFEHICLPLFAPTRLTFEMDHESWTLEKGEALRPDAYPPDEIEKLRQQHQGSPFWLYYQQGLGPKEDDFEIEESHFPVLERGLGDIRASGAPVVLSVDPAQKTNSSSRNVIHVYTVHGTSFDLLQVFAEKCTFDRLYKKIKYFAERYQACHIIVEDTARGSDLIEKLRSDLHIPVTAANPRGRKGDRLRRHAPVIREKRIRIKSRDQVEEAIREIVAYPNAEYDDHVDALTNMLDIVPNLDLRPLVPKRTNEVCGLAVAFGSRRRFPSY